MASAQSIGGLFAVAGYLVGGFLGNAVGPRQTIVIAALGHLLIFIWVFFSPLRTIHAMPIPIDDVQVRATG
jgi:hypothetical protein